MRSKSAAAIIVVAGLITVWGCGSQPESSSKIQSLETRIAKLEQDLKSLEGSRDAAKKSSQEFELKYHQEQVRVQEEQTRVAALEKERDELRATLKTRTEERDGVYAQYEGFRKGLKQMLGQADVAAAQFKLAVPTVTVIPAPTIPVLQLPPTVPVVVPSVLPPPKGL